MLSETDQSGDSGLRVLIKLIISVFCVRAMAFKYSKSIVTCAVVIRRFCSVVTNSKIDLAMVFDAILTSRQTCEKLQCLYENLMSNNFRKTAVLKKKKNQS